MAAADFRFDIRTPLGARSYKHQIGSPQVRRASFLPVHRIYVSDSCMSIGHWVIWPPRPSEPPHIRFLFVEHAFCYRLPPDLVLPLRPCRVANSSPHRASSGISPYRSAPCWAHQIKKAVYRRPFRNYWSGRRDSNSRPLAPHASALPGCATPRLKNRDITRFFLIVQKLFDFF